MLYIFNKVRFSIIEQIIICESRCKSLELGACKPVVKVQQKQIICIMLRQRTQSPN